MKKMNLPTLKGGISLSKILLVHFSEALLAPFRQIDWRDLAIPPFLRNGGHVGPLVRGLRRRRIILAIWISLIAAGIAGGGEPTQTLARQHFVIYHNDVHYANKISWKAEGYYKTIIMHIGVKSFRPWEANDKCPIYIFDSREDYIKTTGAPDWSSGIAQREPLRLAIYKGAPELETKTLPHEITHLVLFVFFGKNHAPLWLEEGIAQYEEEKAGRHFHKIPLKEVVEADKYIKLSELFSMNRVPEDRVEIFYLEALSIVEFLITQNLGGLFGKFMEEIKKGQSAESALKKVYQWKYKNGTYDLEKAWLTYVRTRY